MTKREPELAGPSSEPEFVEALGTLSSARLPATPAARWLLLALSRHRRRQAWVGEIVEEKLRGSRAKISRFGAFEHPEHLPGAGLVPELPGWSYRFHGVGCCLTHADGTCLDVDFVDGETEWIDPFFFHHFLESLPAPELVETRLVRPKPLSGFWRADLLALSDAKLIERRHRVRLTTEGEQVADAMEATLEAVERDDHPWRRAWAALCGGDAEWAMALLGQHAPPVLREQAQAQRRERARWLKANLRSDFAASCLQALAELGRDQAEESVLDALRREPVDGAVGTALDLVAFWSDARHAAAVLETAHRTQGEASPPAFVRVRAAAMYLGLVAPHAISTENRSDLLEALARPARALDGEAGFLLALLDLDLGLERLGAVLESEVPYARAEAASALGLIGTDEAMAVLRSSDTIEARTIASLLRGQEPETGPGPPGELIIWRGRPKRVYRVDEASLAETTDWTAATFEDFERRFGVLRNRWLGH